MEKDGLVPVNRGLMTGGARTRIPPGGLVVGSEWIYLEQDPDRPQKFPGRTSAGALGSSTSVKDISFAQFEDATDQLLLVANSKLYEADAGTSVSTWTTAKDQQGSPVDYTVSGGFLKTLPDIRNGIIAWGGAANERALIRDNDGQWRRQSLLKPGAPTLSSLKASSGAETRPDAGASGTDWINPNNARDGDEDTFASCTLVLLSGESRNIVYSFTGGGATLLSGKTLYVDLETSSIYLPSGVDVGPTDNPYEDFVARIEIAVDQGDGYVTEATYSFPTYRRTFALPLDGGSGGSGTFNNLKVKVTYYYTNGTINATVKVYDIVVASGAAVDAIASGTYSYAQTEIFRKTLSDGRIIEVESAPSDVLSVDATGGPYYGILLNLASRRNQQTDGYADGQMFRRIYRSTSTGSWPNLGLIAEIDISQTTYLDNFQVSGITLGIPSINIVSIANALTAAAGQAPSIYDAAFYRGSLVVIPAGDRRRLAWALPGFPEYFPVGQSFPLLASTRNDELVGVTVVNGNLILFLRTKVVRLRSLPFADDPGFNVSDIDRDELSPNHGLAGTPRSYCEVQAQNGASVVVWVSDNGIWMTDGSAPDEEGMGAKLLTGAINWEHTVDVTRLAETKLTFDPVMQAVFFDYYNPDGDFRSLTLHTSPRHWHDLGGEQVPKIMGPHPNSAKVSRVMGELSGRIHHWSCNSTTLFNERTGTDNAGAEFTSYLETGWSYPNGPLGEAVVQFFGLDHSDWGIGDTIQLRAEARDDTTGDVSAVDEQMSLAGDRITHKFINLGGQAFRFSLAHTGKTSSFAVPSRAIGPILLLGSSLGNVEGDTA